MSASARTTSTALTRRLGRHLDHLRRSGGAHPVAGRHVVAGCSGGVDSVVLVHALAALGAPHRPAQVTVAFIDHGLRDYDNERGVVHGLARGLDLPFREAAASGLEHADNTMAAARSFRYDALARIARESGAPVVATGHHAGDQAESILHGLLSHGSLAATAGITPLGSVPGHPDLELLRPLLTATRADVLAYARAHGLQWIEDPGNADPRRVRQGIRHEVLPALEQRYPEPGPRLARVASEAAAASQAIAGLADALLQARAPGNNELPVHLLQSLPQAAAEALVAAWLRRLGLGRSVNRRIIGETLDLARRTSRQAAIQHVATRRGDIVREHDTLLLTDRMSVSEPSPPSEEVRTR